MESPRVLTTNGLNSTDSPTILDLGRPIICNVSATLVLVGMVALSLHPLLSR